MIKVLFKRTGILLALPLSLLSLEIGLRYFGFVDVPVYDVDDMIGYVTRPNQHGSFINEDDWYFNEKSMPMKGNYDPNMHPNVLLIGNSIIMGGNAYKQNDKITNLMQSILGEHLAVGPIAIGGWTQTNEMVYLDRHPEVAQNANLIAWEYMSGGLSGLNPWRGEYTFPTQRPVYATWYVVRRYILTRFFYFANQSELPLVGEAQEANIQKFEDHVRELVGATHKAKAGFIWLYPTADQLIIAANHGNWLPERGLVENIAKKYNLDVVDISSFPEWNASLYRDGTHPNVAGNIVLAKILSQRLMSYID